MKEVLDYLDSLGLAYNLFHHEAVFTVEEAKALETEIPGVHCKNLFLRNRSGKTHYLVILEENKEVDLKTLSKILETTNLSFASEKRLFKYLKLKPGSVGPFGLIHDLDNQVSVVVDKSILEQEYVTFHPNDNSKTLSLSTKSFQMFLEKQSYNVTYLD